MKCQNCGKNEVNFKYTQIINGVKKEMALCDKCAKELGLENLDFNIPVSFSNFFTDFFNDVELLPSFAQNNAIECDRCKTTFDDFVNTGKFGCSNCYMTFEDRLLPLFKNLHGLTNHIGKGYKTSIDELEYNKSQFEESQKNKETTLNKNNDVKNDVKDKSEDEKKKEKLESDLQKAIKDERYEDAAKIRDELKKLSK